MMRSAQRTPPSKSRLLDLGGRIALSTGIAAFGIAATSFSLAQTLRGRAPETASALAPYDAKILALRAEVLIGPGSDPDKTTVAAEMARQALRRDAVNASAAATLGMVAAMRNDVSSARRLFSYEQRLSRRDYRTQLWAIEDAVSRGDIAGALHHYDIALRTVRMAPELLFPVLASAVSDPRVRMETARTLQLQPAWGPTFVRQLASTGPDYPAVADLFVTLNKMHYPFPDGAHASLIAGLIAQNSFEGAWTYYAGIHRNVRRTIARDPGFAAMNVVPSAFDWNPVQNDTISGTIQTGRGTSLYAFSIAPGQGGLLLRQLQMLPPGNYHLDGRSLGAFDAGSAPYWTLICLNGTELGLVPIAGGETQHAFAGRFTVPAACPVQWLSLIARPSDAIGGQTGELDRTALRPDAK